MVESVVKERKIIRHWTKSWIAPRQKNARTYVKVKIQKDVVTSVLKGDATGREMLLVGFLMRGSLGKQLHVITKTVFNTKVWLANNSSNIIMITSKLNSISEFIIALHTLIYFLFNRIQGSQEHVLQVDHRIWSGLRVQQL